MSRFGKFMTVNGLKRKDIASYLGVSGAFITQIKNEERPLPPEKLAMIQANGAWDSTMLTITAPSAPSAPSVPSASRGLTGPLDVTGLLRGTKITSSHVRSAVEKALHPDEKIMVGYLERKAKDLEAKIAEKDAIINQLHEQIGMLKAELNLIKEGKV